MTDVAIPASRRRFTVDEYEQMAEAGILGEDDRVELLEGDIVEMAPIGPRHAASVKRLIDRLAPTLHGRAIVSAQDPIRIESDSEPQPDIALLRPRHDFYAHAHPSPQDVLLVIEVSDSTAWLDRRVKMPLYARAGIPQAWLVDLDNDVIEVYRGTAGTYGDPVVAAGRERVVVDAFPDIVLTAVDVLG
jgi:Uma2 family endonuclease